ncbi:hypothetical protein PG991_000948 [Apiospora marii]|uniref:Uncharacterized protein n=1 Tax=Apiospora marii TaxID=335849 RepID=A0ABR1STF6_9PEZI
MDILEPVCAVLLRSTLEGIRDRSPSNNANFTHAQDLKRLSQAVHQPLTYFYNVLNPSYPSLQNACEPYATQDTLARLEVQLRQSVIQPVQADIYSSRPNEVVSEQQLVELQNLRRRAGAVALPDLEQLAKLFSTRKLTAAEQQRRLASMRRDVERHWQGVQAGIQGGRSDVPDSFDGELFSSNYQVQDAMHKSSNQMAGGGGLGAQQQVRPPQAASRPTTGSPAHKPSPSAQTQGQGPTSNGPKKSRPGNGKSSTPKPRPQAPAPGRASPVRKQVGSTGHQPLPQSTKNHGSQPRPAANPPPQKVAQRKPPAGRAQAPPPQNAPIAANRRARPRARGPGERSLPKLAAIIGSSSTPT